MTPIAAPTCSTGVSTLVAVTTTGSAFWVSCASTLAGRASESARTNHTPCRITTPSASKGVGEYLAARSPDSWISAVVQPSRDDSQWLPQYGFGLGSPLTVAGPCRIGAATSSRDRLPLGRERSDHRLFLSHHLLSDTRRSDLYDASLLSVETEIAKGRGSGSGGCYERCRV